MSETKGPALPASSKPVVDKESGLSQRDWYDYLTSLDTERREENRRNKVRSVNGHSEAEVVLEPEDVDAERRGVLHDVIDISSNTTIDEDHFGCLLRVTGNVTITFPSGAPTGAWVNFQKIGVTGTVSFAVSGGDLQSFDSLNEIVDENGGATVTKVTGNDWWAEGRLA